MKKWQGNITYIINPESDEVTDTIDINEISEALWLDEHKYLRIWI
jgi:hypothetical protein